MRPLYSLLNLNTNRDMMYKQIIMNLVSLILSKAHFFLALDLALCVKPEQCE